MPETPHPKKKRRTPRIYKNRRGVLRRDELFEIIQCSMADDGWKDLTLRQIASGAGVSVGLVLHHFAGRDDIARSFYEELCADLALHVREASRGPFATVFREFMAYALDQHAFIGAAYADTLRLALRTRRPLPSLTLVFANLVGICTDVDRERLPLWLLAVVYERLIARFMFGTPLAEVMESVDALAPWLAALDARAFGSDGLPDHFSAPAAQIAGTEWHHQEVRRSLGLGLPSRNSRRIRDARRRSGEGA